MSRGRSHQMAPAHATMMKNAITDITMQPTITSMRDSAYSFAVMPFSTTAACRKNCIQGATDVPTMPISIVMYSGSSISTGLTL